MTTSDWINDYATQAVNWLEPVLYLFGLVIAVWAFRRCGKRGYMVLAFYFVTCLFYLLVMPYINSAIHARHTSDISEQTQQKIQEAVMQATDRVLEEAGHPTMHATRQISFPLGPLALVLGVWLVARRESRKEVELDASPSGRPVKPLGSSGIGGGPPSVS